MLSARDLCALLRQLVKFGTARHHDNSGTVAKYLGTIQSLHNFLEASPKRYALFGDTET